MRERGNFHKDWRMEMESNEDYHRSPSPGSKHDKEKVVIEVNNGVKKRNYSLEHFTAVVKPVALTMALAALVVTNVRTATFTQSLSTGLSVYTVYNDVPSDSGAAQFGKAIVNALVIVGAVLLMTFLMVCLYYFRLTKVLYAMLIFTTVMSLSYTLGIICYIGIIKWGLYVDMISLFFFLINFAVGGVTAIFWGNAPIRVTQGYLVIISVIIAYLLSFFPEWTSWTLMVGLSFYDMFAVLTPYGPLKCLVEMAMQKGDPIPGLIYEAKLVHDEDEAAAPVPVPVHTAQASRPANPPPAEPTAEKSERVYIPSESKEEGNAPIPPLTVPASIDDEEEPEDDAVKLGLGDFIFYSMLVCKAALFGFTPFATCYITILFGLITTMMLLAYLKKPLPALPVSMLLGVAFYFLTRFVVVPMITFAGSVGIYL